MATITNSGYISYSYGDVTNSTNSNTVSANLLDEYAITATKDVLNSTFRPGENLTYVINITNSGVGSLYNVTVTDNLGGGSPTNLTFLQGSSLLNLNGVSSNIVPTSTNPLTFVIAGPISASSKATITYVATVSQTIGSDVTNLANTATISANGGSETGDVVSVDPPVSASVSLENYANITAEKSVSSSEITPGVPFTYTFTLTNNGNTDASNVVLTDILPTGFVISDIKSASNGVVADYDSTNYSLDARTNTLTLPSEGSSLSIKVLAGGVTTIDITGSIAT